MQRSKKHNNDGFQLSTNVNKLNSNEVKLRLIKIIFNMSSRERKALLNHLEHRQTTECSEKRRHIRRRVFIYVSCTDHVNVFADFIHNVSKDGMYVESNARVPLLINQELTLTFSHPVTGGAITRTGNIVRADGKGFGVKFNDPVTDI